MSIHNVCVQICDCNKTEEREITAIGSARAENAEIALAPVAAVYLIPRWIARVRP